MAEWEEPGIAKDLIHQESPDGQLYVEVFVDGMMPEGADAVDPSTWEHWLKCWLEALKPTASPINAYELSLRLTHDQDIQQLNATYRQQDKPTDVLAFAALEDTSPIDMELRQQIPTNLGDIVISVETAQRQAAKYGHSLKRELIWLSAHGLLHLLGWDHPDELSLQRMLSKQSDLLSLVGNPG